MEAPSADSQLDRRQDRVVEAVAWALGEVQWLLNAPRHLVVWITERFRQTAEPWLYVNYFYVTLWGLVLAALWVADGFASSGSSWKAAIAAIALWRAAELIVWYLRLLLDREHRELYTYERNLLFLALNGAEFVAIVGLLLRAGGEAGTDAYLGAVTVILLNGPPEVAARGWALGATVLGTLGGLLLVGAGLALVVGLIAERFRYGRGPYTGPMRRNPPWRKP